MRSKKYFKILFIVYLMVLAVTIKIFPLENSKMGLMNAIDDIIQTYQDTVTQEPVDNITDKMYVTLIDEKSRVIATTNPNTKIDTTNKIKLTDNISILFEIPETKDNTIKDDIYYYLDLPEYIIPNEENIIGTENGPSEPIALISSTGIKAIGGIYKNGNGYRFKIKFTDTKDELDIKATYQFNSKLSKDSAPNEGINNVDLDFGLAGIVKVVVDIPITPVDPVEPEKDDFELTVDGVWEKSQTNTSSSDINSTWTVTLKDNRETPIMESDRTLNITFPGECNFTEDNITSTKTNCMAIPIYANINSNILPFKIYADDVLLTSSRNGQATWLYQHDNQNYLQLELTNDVINEIYGTATSLSKGVNVKFYPSTSLTHEVKEWKIVFDASAYNIDNTKEFELQATLSDETNENEKVIASNKVYKQYQEFDVYQGITINENDSCLISKNCNSSVTGDGSDLAKKLIYQVKTSNLANSGHNYVEITVDPNYENTLNAYYYTNPLSFYTGKSPWTLENSISKIKIGNEMIDWRFSGSVSNCGSNTFVNNCFSNPESDKRGHDPLTQSLIYQLTKNMSPTSYLYVSSKQYDEKYYFLVISPETYQQAENDWDNGYYNMFMDTNTFKPLKWKIYLFNTLGKEVEMQYETNLGMMDFNTSEEAATKKKVTNQVEVKAGNISNSVDSAYITNVPSGAFTKRGIYRANHIVEWNLGIDYQKFLRKDLLDKFGMENKWLINSALYGKIDGNHDIGGSGFDNTTLPPDLIGNDISTIAAYDFNNSRWTPYYFAPSKGSDWLNYSPTTSLTKEDNYVLYSSYLSYATINRYVSNDYRQKLRYFTYFSGPVGGANSEKYTRSVDEVTYRTTTNITSNEFTDGNSFDSIRLKTSGIVPIPKLSKSKGTISTTLNKDNKQITKQKFSIHADTSTFVEETGNTYYYNGHIDISDDMSNSTIKAKTGTESNELNIGDTAVSNIESIYEDFDSANIKVGSFTKLTNIRVVARGTGGQYGSVFTENEITTGKLEKTYNGVKFTLDYKGDMEQGFNIALDNLEDVEYVDIDYTTEFDHEAFCSYLLANGHSLSSAYKILFTNNAYLPNTDIKAESVTNEIDVTTYLAVDKYIEDTAEEENYVKKYKVETTTGYSTVPYLDLTDSINRYLMIDKDANVLIPFISDSDAIKALASSFDLSDIVITMISNDASKTKKVIYENDQFVTGWENSTFKLSDDNNDGLLYEVHLENNTSNILPGTTFRIEYTGSLDMEHTLDNGQTFRESDYYPEPAQRLFIDSLVNAKVEHQSINIVELANDTSIGNKIVGLMQVAGVNASNALSVYGGAAGTYLSLPKGYKQIVKQTGLSTEWKFDIYLGTIGKTAKVSSTLTDTPVYRISNNLSDEIKEKIISLLQKYQSFEDVDVYYDNDLVIQNIGILEDSVNNTMDDKEFELHIDKPNNMYINYSNLDLGTHLTSTYKVNIDSKAFQEEAKKLGILDDNYRLIGDENNNLRLTVGNKLDSIASIKDEWGSQAIITEAANISKRIIKNDDKLDETTWRLTVNTGTVGLNDVVIHDQVNVVTDEELQNIIEKSIYLKDFIIRLDGREIYNSKNDNPYGEGFNNSNLILDTNGLEFTINIKNSNDDIIIGDNQTITVEYITSIDKDKYGLLGGKNKAKFSLDNTTQLIRGEKVISTSESKSNEYTIDEPITISKTNLGNNSDLSETKFKIVTNTKNMTRLNYTISDEVSSEYKKYLSIKDIIIKVNDKVYDINNVNIYKKGTKDKFEFNSIGNTDFDIVFDKLNSNTKIEVEYIVKLDKNSYLLDNNDKDINIDLTNSVLVSSNDGAQAQSNSKADVSVPSKFTKQGRKKGFSVNNLPLLEWSINVNLLSEYTLEELESAEVVISDKLNASLRYYEDSIEIYNRITTPSGSRRGTKISKEDYEFTIDNNVLSIKLLKPNVNSNIEIVFSTESITSLSQLDNNATLTINGKTEEVKSDTLDQIITTNTSGTVTSTKVGTFTINAYKLLDGKSSTVPFEFKAVEVDEDGNIIEDGYNSIVKNSEDGLIRFDSVRFTREGTYYYEISEIIDEDSKKYNYDKTKYILKLKVEKKDHAYIITKDEIISPDNREEIIFNNKTIPKDKPNNIAVPNTIDNIVKYLIMMILSVFMIVISTIVFKKRLYRK